MERGLQRVNHQGHLAEWSRRVEACRKSGQRVSEWCAEQGIPASTYYSWQRKVFQAAVSKNEVCMLLETKTSRRLSSCGRPQTSAMV